jgi:hypothetical protein
MRDLSCLYTHGQQRSAVLIRTVPAAEVLHLIHALSHVKQNPAYLSVLHLVCRYFLGAFAKLRKDTTNSAMSVRPSAWNNSAPTGRILMKVNIEDLSKKKDEKIQVSLKVDKNNGYFT